MEFDQQTNNSNMRHGANYKYCIRIKNVFSKQMLEFVYQEWEPVIEEKKKVQLQTEIKNRCTTLPVRKLAPEIRTLIQEQRIKKRWTIRDLADKLDAKPETVVAYETGKEFPNSEMISKLQNVLGTKLIP